MNLHSVTVRGRRPYSKIARTDNTVGKTEPLMHKLHPYYVSGFADGESSFTIVIRENRLSKTGFSVELRFSIGLHEKDRGQLDLIQASELVLLQRLERILLSIESVILKV